MKVIVTKSIFCLVSMIIFLILAIITKDIFKSEIFACLGIIMGFVASKILSNKK